MYKLNNILLSDYHIVAGRSPNSNIAVSGFLDMPSRIGKTHHSWGDHHGVEPYVMAQEIFFKGRDISFYGLIKSDDKSSAVYLLQRFYKMFNDFTELVEFETPYGVFQLYVRDEIEVDYLNHGWCKIVLKFREPIVEVPSVVLPIATNHQLYGIDGIPFKEFGAFIKKTSGYLNRPNTKGQKTRTYGAESFEITKRDLQKVELQLVFVGDSFTDLKNSIFQMHKLFASEGLREINLDMTGKKVFAIDGFQVKHIQITSSKAVAELSCQLVVNDATSFYEEGALLADNQGNTFEDNQGNKITV